MGSMPWNVFFERYIKGEVPTGPVHLEWWEHKGIHSTLITHVWLLF